MYIISYYYPLCILTVLLEYLDLFASTIPVKEEPLALRAESQGPLF